jgi:hypothetical protein
MIKYIRKTKNSIAILLAIVMIATFFQDKISYAFTNTCNYNVNVDGPLPAGVAPCSTNNFKFNSKLYYGDGTNYATLTAKIVAYGSPGVYKINGGYQAFQGFVQGSQSDPDTASTYNASAGRYLQNGVHGEYPLHGYTVNGDIYPDMQLKNTQNVDGDQAYLHWIYRPWDTLSANTAMSQPASGNHGPGFFNDPNGLSGGPDTVGETTLKNIKNNIFRSYGFNVSSGINGPNLNAPVGAMNAYDFSYISQHPTLRNSGSASMWHKSQNTGKLFLQSFELKPLNASEKNDPTGSVTASYTPNPLSTVDMNNYRMVDTVPVDVTIIGTLNDGINYNNPLPQVNLYTRYDIKDWTISIGGQAVTGIAAVNNLGKKTFTVNVPIDQIIPLAAGSTNGKYIQTATTKVNFVNGVSTFDTVDVQFNFKNLRSTCECKFNIAPSVIIQNISDISDSSLAYKNASAGTINRYTVVIKNLTTNISLQKNYLSSVSESVIQKDMVDFIRLQFQQLPSTTQAKSIPFNITQTAYSPSDNICTVDSHNTNYSISKGFVSLEVEPQGPQVHVGASVSLHAIAKMSDGTKVDVTSLSIWNSVDTSTVTVGTNDGEAEGKKVGSAVVKATFSGLTATTTVSVVAPDIVYPPPNTFFYWVITEIVEYPPPLTVEPDVDIPIHGIDIVGFPAIDHTVGYSTRTVTIDGVVVDDDLFFSGNYKFGIGNFGKHMVIVKYTSPDDLEAGYSKAIYIHDSKPKAQFQIGGIQKENRTMTATNNSLIGNDSYVTDQYPLSYTFQWQVINGDGSSKVIRTDTPDLKEFMYRTAGTYSLTITASNSLGRVSDPYTQSFEVHKDEGPAITLHSFNAQVGRTDKVKFNYSSTSTDGDLVNIETIKVYRDNLNNGSFSQLVGSFTKPFTSFDPSPYGLGNYKVIAYANEKTTQPQLTEFLLGTENRENTATSYFNVDNYQPISNLYVDIPPKLPIIDTFFMLDSNLDTAKSAYINGNAITIRNLITSANIDPVVASWDMRTYDFTQNATTTQYYGSSAAPASIPWSEPPYSGTLNKTSDIDASYTVSGTNSVWYQPPSYTENYVISAAYDTTTTTYVWNAECVAFIVAAGGSSTNLVCATVTTTTVHTDAVTGTRTVTPSGYYVNEPYSYRVYNYGGNYSGTLHNYVRQDYNNASLRVNSDKYIVYISDGTVSQLADLKTVIASNTAKLILIGSNTITSTPGITYDKFFLNNKPIDQMVADVVAYIKQNNPLVPHDTILVGDSLTTKTASSDMEFDSIVSDELMIYQNKDYYDNSQGYATLNGATLTGAYSSSQWKPYASSLTYSKPGLYTLTRRIKDSPSSDPNFANYGYYSNESSYQILVNRIPIADFTLDWDFNTNTNEYMTTWVDKSYDLDHNISDPVTKGIIDRKILLKNNGTGTLQYIIPTSLPAGNYTLTYQVQDVEENWSLPVSKTFNLSATIPIQFDSNLRSESSSFSLTSIPASESIRAFELWTRYPYSLSLNFLMGSYINQTTAYYTGTKLGNDISWNDVVMQIPATTPDGPYTFNISANGLPGVVSNMPYTVTVNTPINLVPTLPQTNDLLVVGYPGTLTATTTKYPTTTVGTLFYGTAYSQNVSLTATNTAPGKTWSYSTSSFPNVPDGNYTVRFTSTTPSGKNQIVDVPIKVTHNTPPFGDFKSYTYDSNNTSMPIFEGDTTHIDPVGVGDNEHDTLSVNYTVKDPTGTVVLNSNYTYNYVYPTSGGPTFVPAKVGTYTVTQTLSDGKAAPVVKTNSFNVNALGISGVVSHTTQWETNRVSYNTANPTKTRSASTFWAGERFILASSVTNTGTSSDKANSIRVTLVENGVGVNLTNTSGLNWTGMMWQNNFDSLVDGNYNFTFSVTYSNGVVKTTNVPIVIKDDIWDEARTHRKY